MGYLLGHTTQKKDTRRSATEDSKYKSANNNNNKNEHKIYRDRNALKISHVITRVDGRVENIITDAFFVKNNCVDNYLNMMQDWFPLDSIPEIKNQSDFNAVENALSWLEDVSHLHSRFSRRDYDKLNIEDDEGELNEEEKEYVDHLRSTRLPNSRMQGLSAARSYKTLSPVKLMRQHLSITNTLSATMYLEGRVSEFNGSYETSYLDQERRRVRHVDYDDAHTDFSLDKDDSKRPMFILPDKTFGMSIQDMYTPTLWTIDSLGKELNVQEWNDSNRTKKMERALHALKETGVFSDHEALSLEKAYPLLFSLNIVDCAPEYTRLWLPLYTKNTAKIIPFWSTHAKELLNIFYKRKTGHLDAISESNRSKWSDVDESIESSALVREWARYAKEKQHQLCLDFLLCTFSRSYSFLMGIYESKTYKDKEDGTKDWTGGSDFPVEQFAFGDYTEMLSKYKIPMELELVDNPKYRGVFGLIDNGYSILATCLWRVLNLYRLQSRYKQLNSPQAFHQIQLLIDGHNELMGFALKTRRWSDKDMISPAQVKYIDTEPPGSAPSFVRSPHPEAPVNVFADKYRKVYRGKYALNRSLPQQQQQDQNKNHSYQSNFYDYAYATEKVDEEGEEERDSKKTYYERTETIDCPLISFFPSSVSVCTAEEMPNICQAISTVNPWYEMNQKRDKNYAIEAWIHLFVLKLLNRRCAHRNFPDIAQEYFLLFPQFFDYFKLCIKLANDANFPGVMNRTTYTTRLRNYIGFKYENMTMAQWMTFMDTWNNSTILCLRMYLINCIHVMPAFDNLLRGEQTYVRWRAVLRHCMDYYINRLENTPFSDMEENIDVMYDLSEEMCKQKDPEKYATKTARNQRDKEAFLSGSQVLFYTKASKKIINGKHYHYTGLDEHRATTEVALFNISSKTSKHTMGKIDKGSFEHVITAIMRNVYLTVRSIELSQLKHKDTNTSVVDGDGEPRTSSTSSSSSSSSSRRIKDAMNYKLSSDVMKKIIEDKHPLCNETILNVIAYHVARSQYRKIPTVWLKYLGVCPDALRIFRRWFYLHDIAEMPTNWFKSEVEKFFDSYPKSFNIILSYLSLVIHYREYFTFILPVDVAKRQTTAIRTTSMIDDFEPLGPHAGICYFCDRCRRWCTVVVNPPETIYNVKYVKDTREHQLCYLNYLLKTNQITKTQFGDYLNSKRSHVVERGNDNNFIFKKCSVNAVHLTSKPPKKDEKGKLVNNPTIMKVLSVTKVPPEPKRSSTMTKFSTFDIKSGTNRCSFPPSKRRSFLNLNNVLKHHLSQVRMERTPVETLIDTSDYENMTPSYFIYGLSMWVRMKNPSYDPKKGKEKLGASKAEKEKETINAIVARYGMDLDEEAIERFKNTLKRSSGVYTALANAEKKSRKEEEDDKDNMEDADDMMDLERLQFELEQQIFADDDNNNLVSEDERRSDVDTNGSNSPVCNKNNNNNTNVNENTKKKKATTASSSSSGTSSSKKKQSNSHSHGNGNGNNNNKEFIDEEKADENLDDAIQEHNKERLKGLMSGFKHHLHNNHIETLVESIAGDIGTRHGISERRTDVSNSQPDEEEDIFSVAIGSNKPQGRRGRGSNGQDNEKIEKKIEKKFKDDIDNAQLLFSHIANPGSKKCGNILTAINMIGCIKQTKGMFYALCCECGMLCQVNATNMTNKGPTCGHHQDPDLHKQYFVTDSYQLNHIDLRWKIKHTIYREKDIYEYHSTTPEQRATRNMLSTFGQKDGAIIRSGCYSWTPEINEIHESNLTESNENDNRRQAEVMMTFNPLSVRYEPHEYMSMRCDFCKKFFVNLIKVRVLSKSRNTFTTIKICESEFRKDIASLTKRSELQLISGLSDVVSNRRRKHSTVYKAEDVDPEYELMLLDLHQAL